MLSDINEIDHHLSSSVDVDVDHVNSHLNEQYDSDVQSEMSATPQPTDMANTVIPQFNPHSHSLKGKGSIMHEIKEQSLQGLPVVDLPVSPAKIKTIMTPMTRCRR